MIILSPNSHKHVLILFGMVNRSTILTFSKHVLWYFICMWWCTSLIFGNQYSLSLSPSLLHALIHIFWITSILLSKKPATRVQRYQSREKLMNYLPKLLHRILLVGESTMLTMPFSLVFTSNIIEWKILSALRELQLNLLRLPSLQM